MSVTVKIHRGTDQIGGSITEIFTENTHIFIDFGSELPVSEDKSTDQKMIDMIHNARCDAVLFTHCHGDHVGLLDKIPEKDTAGMPIRLGIGETAGKLMKNIHNTLTTYSRDPKEHEKHRELLKILNDNDRWIDFYDKKSVRIGDFTVTPISADHSAFDSFMLLIEAEDVRILHTGDFRVHGRLGGKDTSGKNFFERLEENLKDKPVDVLITEGTMMSRLSEKALSEQELQSKAEEILKDNKHVFLICSSTNAESLASFHNAAKKYGRPFVVNPYVYKQIKLYREKYPDVSEFSFDKAECFEVWRPDNQAKYDEQQQRLKDGGFVMLVKSSRGYEKRMDYFSSENPLLIYSMWDGYLNEDLDAFSQSLFELYNKFDVKNRTVKLHTGGHAYKEDIEKLILTVSPKKAIIPIHTENKNYFYRLNIGELLSRVTPLSDSASYVIENGKGSVLFDNDKLLDEYKQTVADVTNLLTEHTGWLKRYPKYYGNISKNKEKVAAVCKCFSVPEPLTKYLSVGRVTRAGSTVTIDLRVIGHSVAEIEVKLDKKLKNDIETGSDGVSGYQDKILNRAQIKFKQNSLELVAKCSISGEEDFKSNVKHLYDSPDKIWKWGDEEVQQFFEFIKDRKFEISSEHTLESLLLKEFSKGRSGNKYLLKIQPSRICGQFYQLVTPLKASDAKSDNVYYARDKDGHDRSGGGIDIMTHIAGRRLCVIELKDEYEFSELPEKAIKQAIAYATFIIKLLRSDDKYNDLWYRMFLESDSPRLAVPKVLTVNAVVAMPFPEENSEEYKEGNKPFFANRVLDVDGDKIVLHYMFINKKIFDHEGGFIENGIETSLPLKNNS